MSAAKSEVLISLVLDKIVTKFQMLQSSFRTRMSLALLRILHNVPGYPKSKMAADKPEKAIYRVYFKISF